MRETVSAVVSDVRQVAPRVIELRLNPPEPRLDFAPGQWLSVHLPVGEKPPLVRAYSLAAPPAPSGELTLCLDLVPGGLGSEYLFQVRPGDTLRFAGPLGRFTCSPEEAAARPFLWVARFTGIVPFRAILADLAAGRITPSGITLLYCGASLDELPYLEELRAVAEAREWFALRECLDSGGAGPPDAALRVLPGLVRLPDLQPMVCGKRDFVRPVREALQELGFERRTVRCESYD